MTAHGLIAVALVALAACDVERKPEPRRTSASDVQRPQTPSDVRVTQELPARFRTIGRPASSAEIRAWDIDANPAGAGLPAGRGTYARGAVVYAQQCASCHGAKGEGMPPNPKLVGAEPRDFSFASDAKIAKTIGNYWPYATTLYDYINRAMPFAAPGSLPPGDVYSVVAFLLAENGIIDKRIVIDARTLPRVHMPARDHFVIDDRRGGAGFR
jgi:S-disulfanyl-L-cysteine oxidoreductase SoxD